MNSLLIETPIIEPPPKSYGPRDTVRRQRTAALPHRPLPPVLAEWTRATAATCRFRRTCRPCSLSAPVQTACAASSSFRDSPAAGTRDILRRALSCKRCAQRPAFAAVWRRFSSTNATRTSGRRPLITQAGASAKILELKHEHAKKGRGESQVNTQGRGGRKRNPSPPNSTPSPCRAELVLIVTTPRRKRSALLAENDERLASARRGGPLWNWRRKICGRRRAFTNLPIRIHRRTLRIR